MVRRPITPDLRIGLSALQCPAMTKLEADYNLALDYLYSFVDYSLKHSSELAKAEFNLDRMRELLPLASDALPLPASGVVRHSDGLLCLVLRTGDCPAPGCTRMHPASQLLLRGDLRLLGRGRGRPIVVRSLHPGARTGAPADDLRRRNPHGPFAQRREPHPHPHRRR